jgi:hypothetical protein
MRQRCIVTCIVVFVIQACSRDVPSPETAGPVVALQEGLMSRFNAPDDMVAVIINFREPVPIQGDIAARRAAYEKLADELLKRHAEGLTVSRRFRHVPAMAARISKAALERLMQDPNISYIQVDGTGSGGLKEAVPAIGADLVKSMYNLTGKGVRVAILDTGAVTAHPDLKDSIVAQHCFTQGDCPPNRAREGTSAEDDHGHGSNVAGIITSNGVVSSPGFAPGADIVVVKVDDQNDSGQISDWVSGLDWVFDNLSTLNVKVINLSICSTALYTDAAQCDTQEPALARAVKNLVDAGVTIFSAAGNLGKTTTLSAPACNTGVIAVAATYDSNVGMQPSDAPTFAIKFGGGGVANCGDAMTAFDQITCFSNTPERVDLVTTGAPMTSDGLRNGTSTFWGTSQASPSAAGVAALMLECNPKLTPAQIKAAMVETGVMRVDAKDGHMFPSLRALDAVRAACFANAGSGGAAGAAGAAGMLAAAGSGAAGSAGQAGAGALIPSAGAAGSLIGTAGSGGSPAALQPGLGGAGAVGAAGSGAIVTGPSVAGSLGSPAIGRGAGVSSGCGCTVPRGASAHDARGPAAALLSLLIALARVRANRRRTHCA